MLANALRRHGRDTRLVTAPDLADADVPNDGILEAAAAPEEGAQWPELIIVSAVAEGVDVVLEGHVRLTAFSLAPEAVPGELEVLRGVTPRFTEWWAY